MIKDKRYLNFEHTAVLVCFIIVCCITLAPLFKIGFTCSDDVKFYLAYLKGHLAEDARIYAQGQGRFSYILTAPLYSYAYIFDNFFLSKFMALGCLLVSYCSFAYLVNKLTDSKTFSYFILLILIAVTPVTINLHLPFIAYPCYFTLSFCIFLWGVIYTVKYFETNKYKYLTISSVLFFCSMLFYETYVLFTMFVGIAMLIYKFYHDGIKASLASKKFYKEIAPIICCGVTYIFLYVTYRTAVGNQYAGSTISSNFSLRHFFIVLYKCTLGILPLQNFSQSHLIMSDNSHLYGGHYMSFGFALTHAPLIAYVNSAIQILLLYWLAQKSSFKITWKYLAIMLICSVSLAFASHLLIAVTTKYNNEWVTWMQGYVTSYYSYFFIILSVSIVFYALLKLTADNKILFHATACLIGFVCFCTSVITQYTNENMSRGWQLLQQRRYVLDEMYKVGAFADIDSSAVLYLPDMYEEEVMENIFGNNTWEPYMRIKYEIKSKICSTPEALRTYLNDGHSQKVYYLQRLESIAHNEHFFSLAAVNAGTIDLESDAPMAQALCDSVRLYYYSPSKHFTFYFNSQDTTEHPTAYIDNWEPMTVSQGYNFIPVHYIYWNYDKTPLALCSVRSKNMRVRDFGVTNMMRRHEEKELNPYWRNSD
ncbi:MAG: hypothetical protein IJT51_01310 [Bacteroidales bacterium]|nr:hypothetical protein [Bacteroidales bacterium]